MFDSSFFEKTAKLLSDSLPDSLEHIKNDCQATFKKVLQNCFDKLDLVTREEFDAQTKVLARTRAKVEAMEEIINKMVNKEDSQFKNKDKLDSSMDDF